MNELNQVHQHYHNVLAWMLRSEDVGYYPNLTKAHRGARAIDYRLTLKDPRQLKKILPMSETIALQCQSESVIVQRKIGNVSIQIALPKMLWKKYYRGEHVKPLEVGLGLDMEPIKMSFDPNPHSLFCGSTGSGKTYASMSALMSLFEYYTPQELNTVVIDPHGDFRRFSNEVHLLNFPYGDVAQKPADVEIGFNYVHTEFLRRSQNGIFDATRLLMVLDEPEAIFRSNTALAKKTSELAFEGRKFNVNLLVTSKKPTEEYLPGVISELGNRFVGHLDLHKGTVANILGDDLNPKSLTGKGDFLHVESGEATRFQVAELREQDFNNLKRGNQIVAQLGDVPERTIPEYVSNSSDKKDNRFRDYVPALIAYQMLYGHLKQGPLSIRDLAQKFKMGNQTIYNHQEFALEIANELNELLKKGA